MLLLFTLLLFVTLDAYETTLINDFSADVDIYDMGTMGRGKNACSWHRSLANKQEVFYYLAMQPWRHLVWTDCTGEECYKYFINEDASAIPTLDKNNKPTTKLAIDPTNDYCRKEYANPLPTFDIDWNQIGENDRLEALDINGRTCYKYPAQAPLANIYLQQQYTKSRDVDVMTPCRYDFIGGKSITFRSFNKFSEDFIGEKLPNGYQLNKTKCNIDPSPNNVQTDFAIVLGIADANVVQKINGALSKLGGFKETVKQVKIYYISGNSLKRETVAIDNLASLALKSISSGPVDALINTAKNELITRVNSKEIYRGTIIVLMDRSLSSTFDAETAFDRNNITVHTVLYNPKGDNQMRVRARTLLSVGEQYHEFSDPTEEGITAVVDKLYYGIRTNLTERCSRMTCNGFCDGRDRCTCPMCCENTCFFTYCKTETATCTPWPEAKPKAKLTCKDDCVGTQECIDLQGCVYTEYNPGCAPRAKCMKPYCEDNTCKQKSSCEQDKTPSFENKCWNYTCNEQNGNCERDKSGDPCPRLTDLCHEYVCDANLKCTQQAKTCVKTAPYTEMPCLKAQCNKKTGMCENVLNCNDKYAGYTACGKGDGATISQWECDPSKGYTCKQVTTKDQNTNGFCSSTQICDSRNETAPPKCVESKCNQDLFIDGCEIKTCNEDTGEIEWVPYDCTKNITIKAVKNQTAINENLSSTGFIEEAERYCADKYEIICNGGKCYGQQKEGVASEGGCGICYFNGPEISEDGYHKTYNYSYYQDCTYLKVTCPNGQPVPGHEQWFKDNTVGICGSVLVDVYNETTKNYSQVSELQCIFNDFKPGQSKKPIELCQECFSTVSCYKAEEFRDYTYDEVEGKCDMEFFNEENIPGCSVCNKNQTGFEITCTGNVNKTYEYTLDGKTFQFDYKIPKICGAGNQCIPDPEFDCGNTELNPEIGKIVELFTPCANNEGIQIDYHYSDKFDWTRYYKRRSQYQDFLNEAEKEAYCTFTFEMDPCKYCKVSESKESLENKDKCDDMIAQVQKDFNDKKGLPLDSYTFSCNEFTNSCEKSLVTGNCSAIECAYFYWDTSKEGTDKCANSSVHTCTELWNKQAGLFDEFNKVKEQMKKDHPVFAELNAEHEKDIFMQCHSEVVCQPKKEDERDQLNCTYAENGDICVKAYVDYIENNKDFGCRIPNVECNFDALICTFTEMISPLNDTRFFQDRDGVVFGDNCYNYTCHEYVNSTTGMIEHHWILTESSVIELGKEPETICDTVHCDSVTGKSVSERRLCDPIADYGLSERMAQCFQCACSMQTGENVLTMRPNTDSETYELDACGNCVVRDRATGNQVNEIVECVLAQPVNLTGAIAGATVAASVVFGLIGSMVVVSIGALQTYQLVSSAMKNVISTTLENPEFIAADNEATNVLNNGD